MIHSDVYGHIPQAARILAVARLTRLIVQSVAVTAPEGKRRAETEKTIDSILDGREARAEALVRREALRMASKRFVLLTSPQRRALQEAWSPKTPDKKPLQKRWRLAQRFSHPATSLNLLRRRSSSLDYLYYSDQHEQAAMEGNAPPSRSQESHELPGRGENTEPRGLFLAKLPSDVIAPVHKPTKSSFLRRRTQVMYFPPAELNYTGDLSTLGTWADESADTPPEPSDKAAAAESAHDVVAKTTWLDDMNPDIVDDLLAEWTTLLR